MYTLLYTNHQQKKRNKSRLHRVVRRNNSLLIIFAFRVVERKWRERLIASRAFHRKKDGNGRRVYPPTWIDFRSIDTPSSYLPRSREINYSRAGDRDGVMNYSKWSRPTLRDDLVASQWKRRGEGCGGVKEADA